MLSDFRFAARQLLKTPGFTGAAVLMLGLALGANSAVFSLAEGLVLRPIVPYQPGDVVSVFTSRQDAAREYRNFSHAEFLALRAAKGVFADVAALRYAQAGIGSEGNIRRSFAIFTSENFFTLCGAPPAAGRYYSAGECLPNADIPVAVASYPLWRRMGGGPDFVGSTLRVNGRAYTVIGVSPRDFNGVNALVSPDLWLPLGVYAQFVPSWGNSNLADPRNYPLNLMARVQHGLTIEAANARLPVLAARLTAMQPADAKGERHLQAKPASRFGLNTEPTDDSPMIYVTLAFLGMACCVLTIASLNLANMLLARGTTRARELAVRLAIGASRGRIVRLLLAEGLLLSLAGGALGLIIAAWSDTLLLSAISVFLGSMNLSLGTSVRPDAAVLGFTLVLCILASVIFSLWPALSASRRDLVHGLKQIGSEPTASDRFGRFFSGRHVLVMAQISLSLMLLFSSGLFLRGALMAGGFDLGFEPRGGLVAELDFSLGKASEREAKAATFAALDRIRALPGVRSAGVTTITPYGYHHDVASVAPASAAALRRPEDSGIDSWITRTTPDYLSTIGLRLLSGRDFTSAEATASAPAGVAIIDESLARQLFPKGGALGQRLKYTDWSAHEAEVVGVCTPHRQNPNEQDEHRGHLFVPLSENYSFASATVFLQARLATTDREAIRQAIASIRSALRGMNPELPLVQVLPFSELVDGNIESWLIRIGAALFGVFGAIALVLAVIGVYSVKAYAVSRRTREIGIRMALGAGPRQILGLVLTQGALQTAFALGLGTLLALGAGRLLRSILYHVSPNDPIVLLASASLLAVAAMLACLVPARRATRVDPMVTLRAE